LPSQFCRAYPLETLKDGTEFPAEASISKLEIKGEIICTAILRDISEWITLNLSNSSPLLSGLRQIE
jgi:hypothetical protein